MGSHIISNKGKLRGKIEKVKSKYILQKIFDNIGKDKTIKIVKHNKNLQNKININIDDYEKYWRENSELVEIEIIPAKNAYGIFINFNFNYIYDKNEYSKYCHIYFNNNYKKQIKRNYLKKGENVAKINIIIDKQIKIFFKLFYKCYCIEYITFKKYYRNKNAILKEMFRGCISLKEANISNLNCKNRFFMERMFTSCSSLKKVVFPHVNSNIKSIDATDMFYCCKSLEEINLSDFIDFNIGCSYNINGMFYQCSDELKMKVREKFKDLDYTVYRVFS